VTHCAFCATGRSVACVPVPSNCLASTPLRVALFLVSTFKIRDTLIRVAHDPGRRPSLYRFRVMNSTDHDRCAHHDIAILGRTTADGAAVSEPRRRHVGDSESDLGGAKFAQGPARALVGLLPMERVRVPEPRPVTVPTLVP
jgi:hypothetical protein